TIFSNSCIKYIKEEIGEAIFEKIYKDFMKREYGLRDSNAIDFFKFYILETPKEKSFFIQRYPDIYQYNLNGEYETDFHMNAIE
ncbi:MAG: hypothetical protein GX638_03455, partial [Crenarchaeota archaeon]|nr:hypothetical protein [Thermoproteota archaeon]